MRHLLQCRCGTIDGYVVRPGTARRAICHCSDCRAFARFLARAGTVLDGNGGTAIVATLSSQVHFSQGLEAVACISLSDGRVKSTPLRNLVALLGLMKSVRGARLKGAYKRSPFFDPHAGLPIKRPRVLTQAEREPL